MPPPIGVGFGSLSVEFAKDVVLILDWSLGRLMVHNGF